MRRSTAEGPFCWRTVRLPPPPPSPPPTAAGHDGPRAARLEHGPRHPRLEYGSHPPAKPPPPPPSRGVGESDGNHAGQFQNAASVSGNTGRSQSDSSGVGERFDFVLVAQQQQQFELEQR